MELRHLRCFLGVAEELHFARAAEKLHIEQSPLSRAIKELEEDLGVRLFERTTRSTRLTHAGHIFLEHVPRVFAAISQARDSVKAIAAGYHGQLRIALSDSISQGRLTALLALCRKQEPDVDIRLYEVPFTQQVKGLSGDLYDAGFAQCADVEATRATGLTPHAYLMQRRIHRARQLIGRGVRLADAAADSGFSDQSHMTRLFVRSFGMAPGIYAKAVG